MKNNSSLLSAALLSLPLLLSGCASTNAGNGAAIGAVLGALAGKATGDNHKSRYVWGAIAGAVAGSAIGSYMDKQEKELKAQLVDTGVVVYREGNNLRLELPGDVTFGTGSAVIADNFYPVLDDVTLVLNRYKKTFLRIEGHTDSRGSFASNQILSESRAHSVKNYLTNNSIHNKRIMTQGFGETSPIASNETQHGRAQNRRVELRIIPNS